MNKSLNKENRSCPEHKPLHPNTLLNCATCKRWNYAKYKCREEIWLIPWIEWCADHG